MKRYYVDKANIGQLVNRINQQQNKAGTFVNIAVKPYRGKKYNPATTVVVIVG